MLPEPLSSIVWLGYFARFVSADRSWSTRFALMP